MFSLFNRKYILFLEIAKADAQVIKIRAKKKRSSCRKTSNFFNGLLKLLDGNFQYLAGVFCHVGTATNSIQLHGAGLGAANQVAVHVE